MQIQARTPHAFDRHGNGQFVIEPGGPLKSGVGPCNDELEAVTVTQLAMTDAKRA